MSLLFLALKFEAVIVTHRVLTQDQAASHVFLVTPAGHGREVTLLQDMDCTVG